MNIIPEEIASELNVISLKFHEDYDSITSILFGSDHGRKPDVDSKEYLEFVSQLEQFDVELDTDSSRCVFSKKLSLVTKRADSITLGYIIQLKVGGGQGGKVPKWFATWFSSSLEDSIECYINTQNLPFAIDSALNAWRGKRK